MHLLVQRLSKIIQNSSLFLLCFCTFHFSGVAQSLQLYTPYTQISVSPGQTISYSIKVINNSSIIRTPNIFIVGLPKDWVHTLKSGNWDISEISVLPHKEETLTLQVMVPLKVDKGSFPFEVRARGFDRLPLNVTVSEKGTYQSDFSTKQANLEGAGNSDFTFNATLRNGTADAQLYALNAQAPPGWQVTFKASYKQVASVNVDANKTQDITITVNPPDQAPAGTYNIPVLASTNVSSANLKLQVVVTGSYAMELTTPSGRVSTDITAGDEKRVKLLVRNTGSTTLEKVKLSFTAPTDWDVTFDPKQIDMIPAGKSTQVFATIKASKDAIAGDYVTKLEAKTSETSSTAEFRVSVRTPMIWGWIGILIILLALGSVYYLFRKYGRR